MSQLFLQKNRKNSVSESYLKIHQHYLLYNQTILHSDRGKQFTSLEYKQALEKLGIIHSMSRVGKCIDNGPMEGFFGNIKTEKYYLKKYKNLEELEKDIKEYIRFYNEERLQKNLGNRSPYGYRRFKEKNVDN